MGKKTSISANLSSLTTYNIKHRQEDKENEDENENEHIRQSQ
jgi:hypothetical protein